MAEPVTGGRLNGRNGREKEMAVCAQAGRGRNRELNRGRGPQVR